MRFFYLISKIDDRLLDFIDSGTTLFGVKYTTYELISCGFLYIIESYLFLSWDYFEKTENIF